MRTIYLITGLVLLATCAFSQNITRGPEIGEIYILGLSKSGLDATIYRSTDFGETIECMDSISQNTYCIETVEADKTSGGLYFVTAFGGLHYSNNYGQYGSWDFRQADISRNLHSGLIEGQVYSSFNGHSDDFGINFISHSCNGLYGGLESSEIDYQQGIGYIFVTKWGIGDSLYFLKTTDNFENIQTDTIFNYTNYEFIKLTRGTNEGEIYFYNHMTDELWRSTEFGTNWKLENNYNFSSEFDYRKGVIGGQQEGEVYVVLHFVSNMWLNVNTYVLHSLNNGKTFTLFHPLSKGNQPLLSNFSTSNTEGEQPFTVEFTNYSIGNINEYMWDFEDDGIIDSYEENPKHTYSDTGWHSVRLKVVDQFTTNTFLREDYIHTYVTTGMEEANPTYFSCFPNPFTDHMILEFKGNDGRNNPVLIYDNGGKLIKRLECNSDHIIWYGDDENKRPVKKGIYYVRFGNKIKKVIKK